MTLRCFIAGSPVSQSRSPLIHRHWFAAHGIDATYEKIETVPEHLPALLAKVRSGELHGGNLTIPLKEAVLPLLDDLTPAARAMGAVNTVWRVDGRITGANTDVGGFFAHLGMSAPGWNRTCQRAIVLGAGGAARAVVHGLLATSNCDIILVNRSVERADRLVATMLQPPDQTSRLSVAPWPPSRALLASGNLVINTTSLGMTGYPPLELDWPDRLDDMILSDVVYAPLITDFLKQGEARGARTVDGLGMLLHQASLAFAHWFGLTPAITPALRGLVVDDLHGLAAAGPSRVQTG